MPPSVSCLALLLVTQASGAYFGGAATRCTARVSPLVVCADPASARATDVSPAAKEILNHPLDVPRVEHVSDWLPEAEALETHFRGGCMIDVETLAEDECVVPLPGEQSIFVDEREVVLADPIVKLDATGLDGRTGYMMSGPREKVYFAPEEAKAAIVTCGGLCPGLNTVVKELVSCLRSQYGVEEVYGVKNGYMGFYSSEWTPLELEDVETIHRQGGSLLGSSRGGHDTGKICDAIEAAGVNLVFTIGGDGTMKGSEALAQEFVARKSKVVVAHIPKTIDNDIPLLDSTFGFGTAVHEATRAIHTARDEAVAYPNGVGLVNLMGRHSGFIAAHATMASRGVDVCLVPEVPFELEGPNGLLRYIESRIAKQGYCVVVVAEGAGQEYLIADGGSDLSGNALLAEIGRFLREKISAHLAAADKPASIKYVDPTYMVRATPATAADNILCLQLAHDAVHGAFAGYTSFMSGRVNGRGVLIPMSFATGKRNCIQPSGNFWQQLVFATGQPNWDQ